jgi:thiosulfate/3-mercaptopyruvate sulfurtransferase
MATPHTFVDAETLAVLLGDGRLRLFACRFDLADPEAGRAAYARGHLPLARYSDLNRDLSAPVTASTGRHPLPAPERFEATLRDWGVGRESIVVAYDDRAGAYAARLWWMLRWLGHDDVRVLDGGYARWTRLGLPVVTEPPPRFARGDFVARPRPAMLVSAREVLAAAAGGKARVLDARGAERFRGDVEPIDTVAGHVPGALNHPYTSNLAADGRVLAPERLRAAFATTLSDAAGGRAIAMCGSGVTACHLLLALEHAGLAGARLYPGSWSEWIRDPARPVAKGSD